jgi:hypothetical protein
MASEARAFPKWICFCKEGKYSLKLRANNQRYQREYRQEISMVEFLVGGWGGCEVGRCDQELLRMAMSRSPSFVPRRKTGPT